MTTYVLVLGLFLVGASALPTNDPVIRKLDPQRYHYMEGPDGSQQLVDLWMKVSDLQQASRFNPDRQNVYHLFTRANPSVSQPLVIGSDGLQGTTNFNPRRRTVVIIHGWNNNVFALVNTVLVPAFLAGEDVNVIVVDWGAGAETNYIAAAINTVASGHSVSRFLTQLNSVTGADPSMYHIVGYSLGAHQAGIVGRNLNGRIAYITALDPAGPGWNTNSNKFRANDGIYTEVIHTNAGFMGYLPTLGHVDFYPNGGVNMPGCDNVNQCSHALDPAGPGWNTNVNKFRANDGVYTEVIHTNAGFMGYLPTLGQVDFYPNGGVNMPGCDNVNCNHRRSYYYMGESVRSGGFTGRRCASYFAAVNGNCNLEGTLRMGGLVPKTGSTGIFHLITNAAPPFSRG